MQRSNLPFSSPATVIRQLSCDESKDSINVWFNQVRAFLRVIPQYTSLMDLQWTAASGQANRGLTDVTINNVVTTAATRSTQVEAMLDMVCSYAPELDPDHIRAEATSLKWVYDYIRNHYGVKRTGRGMLQKFDILQRRPNEKLTAFWNRFKGFYAENRLMRNDSIKADGEIPAQDDPKSRYAISSDIVMCLHLAHPDLPREVEKIFSAKLENQDLASLESDVFTRAQVILHQLESNASVRRTVPPSQQPRQQRFNRPQAQNSKIVRRPTRSSNYCSACLNRPGSEAKASTHFLKDCPQLTPADRQYLLMLHDKALKHRLVSLEERYDNEVNSQVIDMVEDYYGLTPDIQVMNPEVAEDCEEAISSDLSSALGSLGVTSHRRLTTEIVLSSRKIDIRSSPSFLGTVSAGTTSFQQQVIIDSGCTGEAVVSDQWAKDHQLSIKPSLVRAARMADGSSSLQIVGELALRIQVCGNDTTINALVSQGGDDFLIGTPAAEKMRFDISFDSKEIIFKNGARVNYRTHATTPFSHRRLLLQTPKTRQLLLPNEEVTLNPCGRQHLPEGRYAVQLHNECKQASTAQHWLHPSVIEVVNNKLTVTNKSNLPQEVQSRDCIGQAFPLVDPERLDPLQDKDIVQRSQADPTWKDISIDPHSLLPKPVVADFRKANEEFQVVFHPDLPKYNQYYGTVEAVINVPRALPPSIRLKEVPWYPRSKLVELQEKFDELEQKGAIVRPQDAGINLEVLSPSFLVAKKPPSNGHRLVTSFGVLANHVRNPPTPITSTDQVLKRLSAWKYLIHSDICQAYHQIPLAKASMKYAGVSTPFRGTRVYTTAVMGMPGSEVALQELTSLLFGEMRKNNQLEILMDDVYIGADSPAQLLHNWRSFLTICCNANIRLNPKKVTIAPQTTQLLGWTWSQGGILKVDQHASNRLRSCSPPLTAEGLRGWIGAYKFLAPAIKNNSHFLDALHAAVGDKTKSDKIEWTEELRQNFSSAQESLKLAEPLTMPTPGQQLYLTTDASQGGIGATLHRAEDGAVVKHFSKKLSSDKRKWLTCELEALAVGSALHFFLPFIRESGKKPIVYSDSTPVVMAYKKLQRGAYSASPRVSTFLHEVLNQGAEIRYLKGPSNVSADFQSRNPSTCNTSSCQVCKWVNEQEDQVVRKLTVDGAAKVLAGSNPMPFTSRDYWRKRQMEDQDLRRVVHHIKNGSSPSKSKNQQRVRRYLQPQHNIKLSHDSLLVAPSIAKFKDTPRIVVPQDAASTLVSVFHAQFSCLAASPLKSLLKRHFFAFNLDELVDSYVKACLSCIAKRDQRHITFPMSSVPPPSSFGEQFAADVVRRAKQKILLVRETATSMSWAALVDNERLPALQATLRQLFTSIKSPNSTRQATCRLDNAPTFKSLVKKQSLADIGVLLERSNPANKNGNPVAEKAVGELHDAIKSTFPSGKPLTADELSFAVSTMNSRPRWSTLSAAELWTGRDQITGETLHFNQQDIIAAQKLRRQKTHPTTFSSEPSLQPGDTVFANSEGNKIKPRDRLIVREDLGDGMVRLDRYHDNSGKITRAFLPKRDLIKAPQPPREITTGDNTQTNANPPVSSAPPSTSLSASSTPAIVPMPRPAPKTVLQPPRQRQELNVPVAPGMAHTYAPVFLPIIDADTSIHCQTDLLPPPVLDSTVDDANPDTSFHTPAPSDGELSDDPLSPPRLQRESPHVPPLRRSSRQTRPPLRVEYASNFSQHLTHAVRKSRSPTPVKKSSSQSSRDLIKSKRGIAVRKQLSSSSNE